ncbi:MAG: fumarylacetoacetate hydrolase family protein [Desulfitobacteriaceae bacterium]|nr:fumarylacetoacetate hydrolase family protein [Desulfitobacteriaceae bacterium]MDI6877810.1 fumarylacetoacetate hydrolase family protein [Desulfitobacteriaceae bacterium]MDI6912851.1 fumarylacetoacetate hydrolase family protein [Desulfitobacteriaceae bacterium]
MNYVRFRDGENVKYGILEGQVIRVLAGDFLNPANGLTGETVGLNRVKLLAPVQPSKVVCIGVNYADHAKEMKHDLPEDPIIFIKPSTTVLDPEGEVEYPAMSQRVDFEGELAVVIGKSLKNTSEAEAITGVFGYTCANDVTARDLQRKDGQWTRGKGFDTFCPLGPWVVSDFDPTAVAIETRLNGQVKQKSNTRNFINPIPRLLSYISQVMTLNPGDVVLTGTPEGVGPMQRGDEVVVKIAGIGELHNTIKR